MDFLHVFGSQGLVQLKSEADSCRTLLLLNYHTIVCSDNVCPNLPDRPAQWSITWASTLECWHFSDHQHRNERGKRRFETCQVCKASFCENGRRQSEAAVPREAASKCKPLQTAAVCHKRFQTQQSISTAPACAQTEVMECISKSWITATAVGIPGLSDWDIQSVQIMFSGKDVIANSKPKTNKNI